LPEGIEIHHMLKNNGGDYRIFQKKFRQLSIILGQFSFLGRVVWLNQYPTIDPHHSDIFTDKIDRYNRAIRLLLT
jgi:hypothetical protein